MVFGCRHIQALIFVILVVKSVHVSCQLINTRLGTIQGFLDDITFNGTQRQVVKYLGIPYGESTGGTNRFAKPTPRGAFSGVYNATIKNRANVCPQAIGGAVPAEVTTGRLSEDCLHLNIYAPADTLSMGTRQYAVMIWIHGGGNSVGFSDLYPGDQLSAFHDVILVAINYRLNVYGFFSTGDDVAKGNYGLWDQHLAIKWVHDNIADFGGNRDEVTVFGGSAGGGNALFQAMYPGNRGLFKRVITQSGPPNVGSSSRMLPAAGIVQCGGQSSTSVLSCLRSKTLAELTAVSNIPALFFPVVDGEFIKRPAEETLADPQSEEMIFYSSLDILYGVNTLDGAKFMLPLYGMALGINPRELTSVTTKINISLEVDRSVFKNNILPSQVLGPQRYPEGLPDIVVDAINLRYTDWDHPNSASTTRDMLMYITGDLGFHLPLVKGADAHSSAVSNSGTGGSTYFYEYMYVSQMFDARPVWMKKGADHTDEIAAVFGFTEGIYPYYHVTSYTPTAADLLMSHTVMSYWTNFARTG